MLSIRVAQLFSFVLLTIACVNVEATDAASSGDAATDTESASPFPSKPKMGGLMSKPKMGGMMSKPKMGGMIPSKGGLGGKGGFGGGSGGGKGDGDEDPLKGKLAAFMENMKGKGGGKGKGMMGMMGKGSLGGGLPEIPGHRKRSDSPPGEATPPSDHTSSTPHTTKPHIGGTILEDLGGEGAGAMKSLGDKKETHALGGGAGGALGGGVGGHGEGGHEAKLKAFFEDLKAKGGAGGMLGGGLGGHGGHEAKKGGRGEGGHEAKLKAFFDDLKAKGGAGGLLGGGAVGKGMLGGKDSLAGAGGTHKRTGGATDVEADPAPHLPSSPPAIRRRQLPGMDPSSVLQGGGMPDIASLLPGGGMAGMGGMPDFSSMMGGLGGLGGGVVNPAVTAPFGRKRSTDHLPLSNKQRRHSAQ